MWSRLRLSTSIIWRFNSTSKVWKTFEMSFWLCQHTSIDSAFHLTRMPRCWVFWWLWQWSDESLPPDFRYTEIACRLWVANCFVENFFVENLFVEFIHRLHLSFCTSVDGMHRKLTLSSANEARWLADSGLASIIARLPLPLFTVSIHINLLWIECLDTVTWTLWMFSDFHSDDTYWVWDISMLSTYSVMI